MNRAAQALGRLAKGVPKHYSAAEIERRSKILAAVNARKRAAAKKRRMPNNVILEQRIAALEAELGAIGYGHDYCLAIRAKTAGDRSDIQALHWYCAALEKTLQSKRRNCLTAAAPAPANPF